MPPCVPGHPYAHETMQDALHHATPLTTDFWFTYTPPLSLHHWWVICPVAGLLLP